MPASGGTITSLDFLALLLNHTAQDSIGLFCCQDIRLARAQLWEHNRVGSLTATCHSLYDQMLLLAFFLPNSTCRSANGHRRTEEWGKSPLFGAGRKKKTLWGMHLAADLEAAQHSQWDWGCQVPESADNWRGTRRSLALEPQAKQGVQRTGKNGWMSERNCLGPDLVSTMDLRNPTSSVSREANQGMGSSI